MDNIHKNHIKIGKHIIQYETATESDRGPGFYIIGSDHKYGPYVHAYDAIDEILMWQEV